MRSTNLASRLCALRWIDVACQALVLLAAQHWFALASSRMQLMWGVVCGLAVFNLAVWLRLRGARPIADAELFAHLCVDVAALAGLLYLSGGTTNPFVSLLLVPLTIAAAILPGSYAWAMAALTAAICTLLLFFNVPLPTHDINVPWLASLQGAVTGASHGDHTNAGHAMPQDADFSLHVLGMWSNFMVSAAIMAFFLVRLAAALRARDRELAAAREAALRNEQILALGTLAAGAAHQLGTPLSTMAVVVRELEVEHQDNAALRENLTLLRTQVDNCKRLLSQLLSTAGRPRGEESRARPLDEVLRDVVDKWRLLRPRTPLDAELNGSGPAPLIFADPALEQALLNLLDNAADASPAHIAMNGRWDANGCHIEILDRGPGIAGSVVKDLGRPFITTKR